MKRLHKLYKFYAYLRTTPAPVHLNYNYSFGINAQITSSINGLFLPITFNDNTYWFLLYCLYFSVSIPIYLKESSKFSIRCFTSKDFFSTI